MNWETYKKCCNGPEYVSRWLLERSIALVVGAHIAVSLDTILGHVPLAKPQGHKGGPETDYFRLDLNRNQVAKILAALRPSSSDLSDRRVLQIREVWEGYLKYLDE